MKNFFFTFLTLIIFSIIFFSALNIFLSGVPLFSLFNIDTSDAVYVSKDVSKKDDFKINLEKNYFVDNCGKNENGFFNLAYKKDKFGFRENNENLYYSTDIVILGNSFGISSCINFPNDLTTQLKNKINDKNILNISKGGTGPYYQKEMMIDLFKKNKTKFNTFIWLFYEGNDHEDINKSYNTEINFSFKDKYNNESIEVEYKPSSSLILIKIKLFFANYFRGFGTLAKYLKTYPVLLPNTDIYEETVNDMNNFLIENGIKKKIIFYIPKYTRLAYKKINHPQLKQLDNLKMIVEETAKKYDFIFIDGSKIYHEKTDPLDVFHYKLPTHFNIEGYELLASELAKKIENLEQ